jgi:thioredoxin reductase (NADPH)
MLVVDADEQAPSELVVMLRRRYGTDYDVIAERTAGAGLKRLAQLADEGRDVAIVLADRQLPDGPGIDFLSSARAFHPDAKRAVLVSWGDAWGGDPAGTAEIMRATALGEIDNYLFAPAVDPDEQFHHALTELLDDWARRHRPRFEVIRIVGERWSEESQLLCDRLERSSIPFGFYESNSPQARALLEQAGAPGRLPVAILHDGRTFAQPTTIEIAEALGLEVAGESTTFDVAVVGAGPAGLAAAVLAASEGLRVCVVEADVIGGQAGTSSLIRNYLGFPRGVSGADLAVRAYLQAWFFGARFLIGRTAIGLRADGDARVLALDDGSEIRSRTVVLAMGISYRRMGIQSVDDLVGRGVFYGAAATEAQAMRDEDVCVVGGANSAGQAAIHLARFAARVMLLVRAPSLAKMSQYLVRDLEAAPNVEVRRNIEILEARGDRRLRSLHVQDLAANSIEELPAAALFILIGAVPRTDWLPEEVRTDERGFVLTGAGLGVAAPVDALRASLETSLSGVFAVGDIRAGSIKRVASSVGEGSSVIRHVHEYLESRADDSAGEA